MQAVQNKGFAELAQLFNAHSLQLHCPTSCSRSLSRPARIARASRATSSCPFLALPQAFNHLAHVAIRFQGRDVFIGRCKLKAASLSSEGFGIALRQPTRPSTGFLRRPGSPSLKAQVDNGGFGKAGVPAAVRDRTGLPGFPATGAIEYRPVGVWTLGVAPGSAASTISALPASLFRNRSGSGVPLYGAFIDLLGAVPVAQGEVIEPAGFRPVRRDGVGGIDLVRQQALDAAVGQADSEKPSGVS